MQSLFVSHFWHLFFIAGVLDDWAKICIWDIYPRDNDGCLLGLFRKGEEKTDDRAGTTSSSVWKMKTT